MKLFSLIINFLSINFLFINAFLNIKFGKKIITSNKEISDEISYKIPFLKKNIFNNLEGFYGLIGPDYQCNNSTNDISDILNKNGVIHGIFFSKGKMHFIRKYVKTNKLLYEEKNGEIPINSFTFLLFELFKNINLLPNIFGLANTALLNFNDKLYALHERDLPYELKIDFINKTINTSKKLTIPKLYNFLAHSKVTVEKNNYFLETIDYSLFNSNVKYCKLDSDFKVIYEMEINKIYTSMVHDFISLNDYLILIDTPMIINYDLIFNSTMPLEFNKKLSTKLHIINKNNNNHTIIDVDSMFLFHYGNVYENNNEIEFYGCFYDNFDFKTPKYNYGKFRKIIINKNNNNIEIQKNIKLEKYSLDFPIIYKNYTILTNSNNFVNKNFVIVKNFEIYKIINFNKNINGEASIIEIDNKPYILCFTNKKNINYVTFQGIENNYHLSIPIPFNISLGFHSIFINNKL